ncbi:MAG: PAS domain S-box protein [Halobacteriaceae archaeon]
MAGTEPPSATGTGTARKTAGVTSLFGLAALVTVATGLAVSAGRDGAPLPVQTLAATGVDVALLGAGGLWLTREYFDWRQVWQVVTWVSLGVAVTAALALGASVAGAGSRGGVLRPSEVEILAPFIGVGVAAGLVTGLYDAHRLRAQRRYERTARRLSSLVDDSPVPIVSLDAAGRVRTWNPAAESTLGYAAPDVVGRQPPTAPEDPRDAWTDLFERLRAGESVRAVATTVETADGDALPVVVSGSPVVDDEGRHDGCVVVVSDRSERRERERRLDTVVENLPLVLFSLDASGRFTLSVGHGLEALGLSPGEVRGESVFELYADHDRLLSGVERALHGETVHDTYAVEGRAFEVWLQDVEAPDGDVSGVIGVAEDVTDRERHEQHFEVVHRVLRHNLRNKVTVIGGAAAGMRETADDERVVGLIETVEAASSDLARLSETAKRIHSLFSEEQTGTVDVAEMLDTRLAEVRAAYPGATVDVDGPATDTARVDATVGLAVYELLENAVRHAGTDATARVTATVEDASLELTVRDDGPGIPPAELAVLERGSETPVTHSSGLGLWLVSWVVDRLGGDFAVDDDGDGEDGAERGATVRLCVPIADAGDEGVPGG